MSCCLSQCEKMLLNNLTYLLLFIFLSCKCNLNLHPDHVPLYFYNFPKEFEKCQNDKQCTYQNLSKSSLRCWGYESDCTVDNSFLRPLCLGDHRGWVRSREEQLSTFFSQADFGYVRAHRDSIEVICEPKFREDSALECSEHLQFCRGRNLFLNLTRLGDFGTWRYRMDVLQPGDLAGFCYLYEERLERRSDHMSPLQSWAPELRNFQVLSRPVDSEHDCDMYFDKPVFILKIDAAVNMYHHLCDFFNLYASLHVNSSHPATFSTDVEIIIWETYPYRSAFWNMWAAFTRHPVRTLDALAGKAVCFRNLVLPLLPRMIFGLYYNTPLVYGCERSGLFKAFAQHILHRLDIADVPMRNDSTLRVTFLSRETSYRNVVNEDDLLLALAAEPSIHTKRVVFDNSVPYRKQLEIIRSTDIFIGMHGAGLTHLLFLPDWAAVFELYNCEDENCYFDLARLRGVKYVTWQDKNKLKTIGHTQHPDGGTHAKFADYFLDVSEFMRIFRSLATYVRSHDAFATSWRHEEL